MLSGKGERVWTCDCICGLITVALEFDVFLTVHHSIDFFKIPT